MAERVGVVVELYSPKIPKNDKNSKYNFKIIFHPTKTKMKIEGNGSRGEVWHIQLPLRLSVFTYSTGKSPSIKTTSMCTMQSSILP